MKFAYMNLVLNESDTQIWTESNLDNLLSYQNKVHALNSIFGERIGVNLLASRSRLSSSPSLYSAQFSASRPLSIISSYWYRRIGFTESPQFPCLFLPAPTNRRRQLVVQQAKDSKIRYAAKIGCEDGTDKRPLNCMPSRMTASSPEVLL